MDVCRVIKLCGKKHQIYDGKDFFMAFPSKKLELKGSSTKNRIAVGDFVKIKIEEGKDPLIVDVLERKNKLSRRITYTGKEHVIASNIDKVGIVVAPNPVLKRGIVDRFLCASKSSNIEAFVVINKVDLLKKEELKSFRKTYEENGIKVFETSVKEGTGLEGLYDEIEGKWVLLAGHSGVGKSSICNKLCPEANLRVGEVDEETLKGRHVTTSATAVRLKNGGFLIDTAGLREFALYNVTRKEIESVFKAISEFAKDCRFSNCSHRNEPDCAVKEASLKGLIDDEEYSSYLNLIKEACDIED